MSDLVALKPGTILADDYRIERTLGAGGFGITYLAEEIALARLVTIKEYFPVDFAARDQADEVVPRSRDSEGDYSWGLDRFLAEAQTLAKFTHPHIVRVYRYFLARNTGYIVLHYEEGKSLKGWLRGLGRAPRQPELDRILEPLLGALETVHAADFLHRDIAPDNIMIRRDGEPVLIDFGSARGDIAKHSKTISALVKPGYSPYEQYATTSRQQGPWTDIYSLGATLYEAVTGRRPPDAPSRMVADELVPTGDAALSSYRPRFLAAIDKALKLEVTERPRSVADWRAELLAPAPQRAEGVKKRAAKAASNPETAAAEAKPAAGSGDAGAPVDTPPAKGKGKGKGKASEPAAAAPAPAPQPVRGGLAGAFLDGWRKGAKARPHADALAAPPEAPPVAPATPAVDAAAPSPRRLPFGLGRATSPLATPEPGARKATPKALRKRSGPAWRPLLAKAVLALAVAGAVVTIQDQIPIERRQGAGVVTSQAGTAVPLSDLKGHRGAVTGLAFSPDGDLLVSVSLDGTLKVWSTARGGLVRTIDLDAGPASALAVTRGRAATGHRDGSVVVWDITTTERLALFKRTDAGVRALAFAGRPDRVAVAANDAVVSLWEVDRPATPVHLLEGHEGAARALAFVERGPFVASGAADQTVKLWRAESGELVRTYRLGDAVAAVTFDAPGRTLAAASDTGEIRLWSTFSNRQRRRLAGHEGGVAAMVFAPDGEHLVSGGADGTIRVWSAGKGRLVRTMKSGVGAVGALGVSPDGRRIAAAGADGTVRMIVASLPKEGT